MKQGTKKYAELKNKAFLETLQAKGWNKRRFIAKYNEMLEQKYPNELENKPFLTDYLLTALLNGEKTLNIAELEVFPELLELTREEILRFFSL